MRVLHVTTRDMQGGAGMAANRLFAALNRHTDVDAHILALDVTRQDDRVHGPPRVRSRLETHARHWLETLPPRLYPRRSRQPFSSQLLFNRLTPDIRKIKPDVIHLHWFNGGWFHLGHLRAIKDCGAPLVWTLHDMWPFTGGCHYAGDCEKYAAACGACPELGSGRSRDLSAFNHWRKRRVYNDLTPVLVAPSRWMADCAAKSSLLGHMRIEVLPNPLDAERFRPIEKSCARRALGLPEDGKIILCGAVKMDDPRKGFDLLIEAVKRLDVPSAEGGEGPVTLLFFGMGRLDPATAGLGNVAVRTLGYLKDAATMPIVYSAADVMVVPSRQESFGQTASEALACGTPVAAFAATGLLDIITHGRDGWLARPFDPESLAVCLREALTADPVVMAALTEAGRAKVLENWGEAAVAARFKALYESALARPKAGAGA